MSLPAGISQGIATSFKGDPVEWLEQHLIIPHSARSTKFYRDQAPWLIDPFRAFCDVDITQINILAPTGGGKTTFLEMIVPYLIAEQPGPTMLVGQNDDTSKEWAETRLIPILENCKPVSKLFPQDRHNKRKTSILFPHMALLICGANMSSLQEKSMRYCYGDECWRWKEGMIGELKKRHHDRWARKTILVSQGGNGGGEMENEYNSGQWFEWGTECLGCNVWHKYEWEDIRFQTIKAENGETDWQAVKLTAKHICPSCGHETPDTTASRREMSSRGSYKSKENNHLEGVKTFHWSAHSVWWISWGDMAIEFLKANELRKKGASDQFRQFMQKRLAKFWRIEDSTPMATLLGSKYSIRDYANGEQIENEIHRAITCDRQKGHLWAVCRAWRQDGSSMLLWEGLLQKASELRELQLRMKVRDKMVFMDEGYERGEVYNECSQFGWFSLKGSGEPSFPHTVQDPKGGIKTIRKLYSKRKFGVNSHGKEVSYFVWSNEGVKDELAKLRGLGPPVWEFPEDVSGVYLYQMTSEIKMEIVDPKTQTLRVGWKKVKYDNHLWDCEAMQVAVAMMLGIAYEPTIE